MKAPARIGQTGEQRFTVEPRHTIEFAVDGMPPVLSTPSLIHYLEYAARSAIEPLLEKGESSVGVEVEVSHLAPTPAGQTVTCSARIVHVEGNLLSFVIEAHDEQDPVARGFHKRRIIQVERFAKRLAAKIGRVSEA